ncbi:hypothetical protein [Ekhidna sp.]|uniref:hypothetical protein n=1 Tax=Ekhidna sp. TaxID=2608089 RepID=UPI003CCB821B
MKKNIIIAGLMILSLVFMIFSFIKADEAEKCRMEAQRAMSQAMSEKARADMQAELALKHSAEASMAKAEAERAMEKFMECRDGK